MTFFQNKSKGERRNQWWYVLEGKNEELGRKQGFGLQAARKMVQQIRAVAGKCEDVRWDPAPHKKLDISLCVCGGWRWECYWVLLAASLAWGLSEKPDSKEWQGEWESMKPVTVLWSPRAHPWAYTIQHRHTQISYSHMCTDTKRERETVVGTRRNHECVVSYKWQGREIFKKIYTRSTLLTELTSQLQRLHFDNSLYQILPILRGRDLFFLNFFF